ncbi:DNA primase [Halobacteriaceae archaeon GCM10025711]
MTLPNPNETVTVDLTATADNQTGTAAVELVPRADSLDVDVAQDGETGAVTMTVTQYGVAVPNATVEVAAANVEYAGEGNHTTDENGTVTLDPPTENITVDATATAANLTASTTADLVGYAEERIDVAVEQTNGSVLVTVVDENGSAVEGANVSVEATDGNYTAEGDYVTDENGTVDLRAPAENVTVEVTATWGNLTDTTTADLTVPTRQGPMTFGQRVSWFVHSIMDEENDRPLGQLVSEFVTSNNPGADHRPDHAGPNQERNTERNQAANNSSVQASGPENPGNGNDQDKGPKDNPGKSGEKGNNGNGPDKARNNGK